ncbi:MAG: sel1 repeat family protein, partial [Muribaculum sp.]|nr:sel1 repeat family protein [Muribaculaceae bacterium]MCM1081799.1 sel1 repeat family protein [Muribaculum sp.]
YSQARQLYLQIPDDSIAQCYIGQMYYLGIGVSVDYGEAFKWYRKAADQNDMVGQECIGIMYYFGHGCKKDKKEAYKWLKMAVDNGSKFAKEFIKENKF